MLALALASHVSETDGGVQVAENSAWLWQLASQFASMLQLGGVSLPSHCGAVAVPVQPPLQLAIAPQLTPPLAEILQSPLHEPAQVPLQ